MGEVLWGRSDCICQIRIKKKMTSITVCSEFPDQTQAPLAKQHHVAPLSSYYALYADMSRCVMRTLERFCPEIEVYSIDEAFLRFNVCAAAEAIVWARPIRATVRQWTGNPVSIGLASSKKTLGKLAGKLAKGGESAP